MQHARVPHYAANLTGVSAPARSMFSTNAKLYSTFTKCCFAS